MAGVSLLVGGISIMNIMLVSVTERTREIGLRLAIGARPRDMRNQFLIEAVALCTGGGAIGVAVGFAVASMVAYTAGWPVRIGIPPPRRVPSSSPDWSACCSATTPPSGPLPLTP